MAGNFMDSGRTGSRVITTKELVIMAFSGAILLAGQVTMAALPNIEIVSLLIYIYTQVYQKKVFFIIYVFVILEGLLYGFGIWWFGYLYVWSILAFLVLRIKETQQGKSVLLCCVVLGAYGLVYGFLFAIPYFVVSGVEAGMAYWIAGIPFDILHCLGNVAVALVLYKPLYTVISKLRYTAVSEL